MKKIIFIVWFLCGCSGAIWSSRNYSRYLQNFVGQNEMSLYAQWGLPDEVINISYGNKVVSYTENYSAPLGGLSQPYAESINYQAINQGFGATAANNYYCTTSFTIQNGIVTNYSFNGSDCVSKN